MIFGKKTSQSVYRILVIIWLLLTVHVGYTYVSFSSDTWAGKGGTFIEATLDQVNYLPYVTTNDADKFYQSLLFNGCVFPTFSGTSISYREELCDVTTDDRRTFQVRPLPGKTWSDGEPVTLNDIYFTYHTLLRENYWDLGALNAYRGVQVNLLDDAIEVVFPSASIDNMIFFTNFILPAHRLANESLETYIQNFHENPIGTNCGTIQSSPNDPTSIVFDLSSCEDTLLKFYQVKQFGSEQELNRYLRSKSNTIDLIISPDSYEGYDRNQVILNKYATFFFNTTNNSITPELRRRLGSRIANNFYSSGSGDRESPLVEDHYLFNAFLTGNQLISSGYLADLLGSPADKATDTTTGEQSLPLLPDQFTWTDEETKEFYLPNPIADKRELFFEFSGITGSYDRVSVTFNNGVEYFPESFDAANQTTYYNLNPTYRNIAEGRNVYTIRGYQNGQVITTNRLIVHYLQEPTTTSDERVPSVVTEFTPLTVIYFADETSTEVIERLKTMLQEQGLFEFFEFISYDQAETFAGKITSNDYHIALRSISMGLRKDMSNLVTSTVADINPSNYTNDDLANAINQFFLTDPTQQRELKSQIDQIYRTDMPLVILGKHLTSMNITSDLDFRYPYRLYVLGWRRDFINELQLFQHFAINWDRVFSIENIENFLAHHDLFQ